MGLVDAFSAEDRVNVKFSDFYAFMKEAAKAEIMANGIKTRIPHAHIEAMLTGKNSELEAYRDTGLSPQQIREMDVQYSEKCKELSLATKKLDEIEAYLKKQAEQAEQEAQDGSADRKD